MTELDAFLDLEAAIQTRGEATTRLPALLFTFAGARYVVAAAQAVGIIPMRPLTRLPGAHPGLAGAIQDRGRVIALLAHPLAVAGPRPAGVRVIVCGTDHGLLGVPVASLDGLAELRVSGTVEHASIVPHDGHAYTFIDVRTLGELCRAGGGA